MKCLTLCELKNLEQPSNVVLFHGLWGNAQTTWTPQTGTPWWQTVSSALGGAAVLSYDVGLSPIKSRRKATQLLEESSRAIVDHLHDQCILNTPTFFVAYSLGGILLKRVIADMNDRHAAHFGPRRPNVRGIAFLGTPHQGSQWATVAWRVGSAAVTSHLHDLVHKSRYLNDTQLSFADTVKSYYRETPIISVIETLVPAVREFLPVQVRAVRFSLLDRPVSAKLVVRPESAILSMENESVVRADSCHVGLPKFQYNGALDVQGLIVNTMRRTIAVDGDSRRYHAMLSKPNLTP